METDEFDHFVVQMELKELDFDPYVALSCILFHSRAIKLANGRREPIVSTHLLESFRKVQPAALPSMKHLCLELWRLSRHLGFLLDADGRMWLRDLTTESAALLFAAELGYLELFDGVWNETGRLELTSVCRDSSPLYHAVFQPFLKACNLKLAVCPNMIRYLISAGCDPNEHSDVKSDGDFTTPWIELLRCARNPRYLGHILDGGSDIFRLFLDRGADLDRAHERIAIVIRGTFDFPEMRPDFVKFWTSLAKLVQERERQTLSTMTIAMPL